MLTAIHNYIFGNPVSSSSSSVSTPEPAQRINAAARPALSQSPAAHPEPEPRLFAFDRPVIFPCPPQVVICDRIKPLLNDLFAETPFSVDTLPVYPYSFQTLNRNQDLDKTYMDGLVVKGATGDGLPFIAIRMQRHLSEEECKQLAQISPVRDDILLIAPTRK